VILRSLRSPLSAVAASYGPYGKLSSTWLCCAFYAEPEEIGTRPPMNDNERFEMFTEPTREVLSLAQEEAQRFNHHYIGTEHLLLGLLREGGGIAATVLGHLGIELDTVRSAVASLIGGRDSAVLGTIGLTPRAKQVLELAVDEARRLTHHIGTAYVLLGAGPRG
jgi:ATP-dependent Clp protease ATP-binding subunit ClpC